VTEADLARKKAAELGEDAAPTESLAIYLGKKGLTKVEQVVKNPASLKSFPITDSAGELGTLYIQTRSSQPPRWAKFFEGQLDRSAFGRVSSAAGVFLVPQDDRVFLLAFGQGRHLLRSESVEDRFGLRVTLNSIAEDRVRSLDKQTFDTIARHTRIQSSKEARPADLGIDVDQDLLRMITGSPSDEALGKTLSGMESLHAMVRVDLEGLRALLSEYLDQFGKDSYKKSFAWVDHVSEVIDPGRHRELDEQMLKLIRKEEFERCWLAVPEPIDWSQVDGFRYRRGLRHPVLHDISFETFLETISEGEEVTLDLLRRRDVHCVGTDDVDLYTWPVYRCIYCEIERDGETHLLSAGKWYRVGRDFVKQVNEEIKRLPKYSRALPDFGDETEEQYNKQVVNADSKTFALMDRKTVSVGGGYSRVEFCDLYTSDREMIHVKRYGGSSVLSHLFAQGTVSAQLFVADSEFRKAVNALLPRSHKLSDSAPRPDAGKFTVVFAVVSHESGAGLTLPFFSRLNLKHAARLLFGFGYKVALAKIQIEEAVSKTKKYRAAR
jgi:uncharacterized protein (TIGR04141 family)